MCETLNNSVQHINHLLNIKDLWDIVMHYDLARKDGTRDQNIAIVMLSLAEYKIITRTIGWSKSGSGYAVIILKKRKMYIV